MDISAFCGAISTIDKMPILLFLALIAGAWMLYKAHKAPNTFDIKNLITDPTTEKVSLNKFGQFIALFVTSWIMIDLTIHDKLSESFLMIYATAWTGISAISKGIDAFGNKTIVDTTAKAEDNTQKEDIK